MAERAAASNASYGAASDGSWLASSRLDAASWSPRRRMVFGPVAGAAAEGMGGFIDAHAVNPIAPPVSRNRRNNLRNA